VTGRQIVPRDRFSGYHRLHVDYFSDNPIFVDDLFRRRLEVIHTLYCNTDIDGNHCTDYRFKFVGSE
jgi:hypothetical protein